jgi:outer membrane protein assembly factor BamB
MRRMMAMVVVAAMANAVTADSSAESAGSRWAHWRGPLGTGASPDATPPVAFGVENDGVEKNVAWKAEIPGRGSSSPVVWDDRVFVTSGVPLADGRTWSFRVFCFDRGTGEKLWERTAVEAVPHEGTHQTNTFASASPCTDGEHVYAHFGSRGLFCYTVDGDLVWSRDFGDMTIRRGFGEGSSPTLVDDLVLVPWDHEGPSMLYALHKPTGKSVWEVPRDEPTGWATPLVAVGADGRRQVVMNGQNAARGYDLETGEELWRCGGQTQRPCASAVAGDGVAYVGSGFRGAFIAAFDLAGRGDLARSEAVRWSRDRDTPDVASPLLVNGRIYYFKEKSGLLTCVDAATGEPLYETRRMPGIGSTYASPIAAGGHVYLTDRRGVIAVLTEGPEPEVVASNDIGEGVDATPAADGSDLFIRGERHLFRVSAE